MKDEHISKIVETTDKNEANAYLNEGWTLIGTCIQDFGEIGHQKNEQMSYHLGWSLIKNSNNPPRYPEIVKEREAKRLEEAKAIDKALNRFKQ